MHLARWAISLALWLASTRQPPLAISGVRSGRAELAQQGRVTVLQITSSTSRMLRVPLTHPSDYLQGTDPPYEARLVTESSHHFLIFTDTFASNPGNVQGQCGASDTGERFVHVVALGSLPHETLSILVESCLLDIEPAPGTPEWTATPDSAGYRGKLTLRFPNTDTSITYSISPDGTVSRPQTTPGLT